MTTFRVHYNDGTSLDVDASDPNPARKAAAARRDGFISKVKAVKEKANA